MADTSMDAAAQGTGMSEPQEQDPRRICVTVGLKLDLGHYESASASVCLSGIAPDASEAEIDEMLATSKVAFNKIAAKLRGELNALRNDIKRSR